MEAAQRKASHGGEMRIQTNRDKGDSKEEVVNKVGNREDNFEDSSLKPLSPADDRDGKQEMDQLESAKAEMREVRQENQRLRMYLDRIMKDYQTLQMQFQEIGQQEAKKAADTANSHQEEEESELVSLSLGRTSSNELKSEEKYKIPAARREEDQKNDAQGLALGLDCKFEVSKAGPTESSMNESPEISLEEVKEEAAQTWPPHRALKTGRSVDDEVFQHNPAKKARVSVRVRCDNPTMNDGCQWRKYGQKISKGNPCPRAYYRCTLAPSCPVRKQVQRYAEDMSILITTYEGTHNHPLPMSATAMASTTSAAASMLMSGSSTSGSGLNSSSNATTAYAERHGLNFYFSDPSKTKQFYLPNSSLSSSHPTITLDLTTNSSSSSSSSSHFNRISTVFPPRYFSTNLNFSSLESNPLPLSWNNSGLNSYGTQPYSKNQIGTLNFGKLPQENLYQSYAQKSTPSSEQSLPQDTIAAATKAITSDPSFQSVLVAALTSIIGSNGSSGNGDTSNHHAGDKFGQNLMLGDSFPVGSNFPSTSNTNKCSSSFLNQSPSTANAQQGSSRLLPASFPFSPSKSNSTSPGDT